MTACHSILSRSDLDNRVLIQAIAMIKDIIRAIQNHFLAFGATLLVPISGAWFTYWERDHSDRAFVRSQYEEEVRRHQAFIEDISSLLLKGEFDYLELYEVDDMLAFRQSIESEALRLGLDPSNIKNLSLVAPDQPPANIPKLTLSDIYGAKLNLLLESSRADRPLSSSLLASSGNLARETLHFLRRSNLLNYGGLWMEADLSGLDLRDSNLACTYLDELKLNNTNLSSSNLSGAFIRTAEMAKEVNFSNARLFAAQLNRSWFSGSDFSDSNMQIASLKGSTLRDSNFSRADLRDATLYGAHILEGKRFHGADLRGSVLLYNQLRSVRGKIFEGAFANSKPIKLIDGRVMPATLIPQGLSFSDLGLVDIAEESSDLLREAGARDGEEGRTLRLPDSCKWKVDGALAQLDLHRRASAYPSDL